MRASPATVSMSAGLGLLYVFLYGPIAYVIYTSFARDIVWPFPPSFTLQAYADLLSSSLYSEALVNSLMLATGAAVISTLLAGAGAIGILRFRSRYRKAALLIFIAPLFVVWFGFGMFPKVLSAFLLGFFPVVVSAVQGFKSVEPDMLDLARSMEANRLQIFRMVSFPHALPAIFAGLKVSITLAVVGAVVGEFVGSNSGIGYVLQRSIGNFELPTMFAALVVLALIGVILFWILDVLERFMIPWHASQRHDIVVSA